MINPLESMYITSKYGMRRHPVFGYDKMHLGIDLRAKTGTKTTSILKGKVKTSKHQVNSKGQSTGLGSYIVIEHELNGVKFCTMVCHLSKRYVKVGDIVKEGQVIGLTGNSGSSSAQHLHFGIHYCPFNQFFTYQHQKSGKHSYREFKHTIDPDKFLKENMNKEVKREEVKMSTINIKFASPPYKGDIINSIDKESYDKLKKYLMVHEVVDTEASEPDRPDNEAILPTSDMKYGSKGNDVRNLQLILNMVNKRLSLGDIDIDGSYGNQMKSALNKYRVKYGLSQNGEYNSDVRKYLQKEELSNDTLYYKSGRVYYTEIHKDSLHGRKEMVNGHKFDDMIESDEGYANATFRWYNSADGKTYPQSPFIADGIVHENRTIENYTAPLWLGDEMPIFSIDKNGKVDMKIENNPQSKEYEFAVGGIKMYPSVSYEGFKISNKGTLDYATARHAISYNPSTGRILIAYTGYMNIYDFSTEINDKGYIYTTVLDSGGSTQLDIEIAKRNTSRTMTCWIVFKK